MDIFSSFRQSNLNSISRCNAKLSVLRLFQLNDFIEFISSEKSQPFNECLKECPIKKPCDRRNPQVKNVGNCNKDRNSWTYQPGCLDGCISISRSFMERSLFYQKSELNCGDRSQLSEEIVNFKYCLHIPQLPFSCLFQPTTYPLIQTL